MMIKLAAPQIGDEECEAVTRVLRSGNLVQGEEVRAFEGRLAQFIGAPYAAAVSSGTSALYISLAALDVGPGDAVFLPAFTFPATANVVELRGARTVLVEVDPQTYCVTGALLRAALETFRGPERPRAAIPVHEFGAPCDMGEVGRVARGAGLAVVEDAACALGTTSAGHHVGTFGALGCFSWHPRKGITTGEGGAVVTSESRLDERARWFRNHGMVDGGAGPHELVAPSLNLRMTDVQAALGSVQLGRFPDWLRLRSQIADGYAEAIRDEPLLRPPAAVPGHAWQTYMVVLSRSVSREQVIEAMRRRGVETGIGAYGLHLLAYYRKKYGFRPDDFPAARELHEQGLAIPLHAGLTSEEVARVRAALRESLREA